MKTLFRFSMVMVVAVLFIWGGVAEPRELLLEGTNYEYLIAMDTGTLPSTPVEFFVLKLKAAGIAAPEPGTWEYSVAMETGNLPSACVGEACGPEEAAIVEFGGIPFRMPLDVGP